MKDTTIPLALPPAASRKERLGFEKLCAQLAIEGSDEVAVHDRASLFVAAGINDVHDRPVFAAAAHTVIDLVEQGWTVTVDATGVRLAVPAMDLDREAEKARIRRQEHVSRDKQLREPSVRRFVQGMEQPRLHRGRVLSVFDLMRDGRELAEALQRNSDSSQQVIRPYVQIVDSSTCDRTGYKLHDIWRYFRHTWSNAYLTVPGRSMPILVRDAATEFHAVIGLAAISSPVVQIAERDRWMGWETDVFLNNVAIAPTQHHAEWFARRIETQIDEIYLDDLLRAGVLQPTDLKDPTPDTIKKLRADSEQHRLRHHTNTVRPVRAIAREAWVERAETHLFRSKRAAALFETLETLLCLRPFLMPEPTADGLAQALKDSRARAQLRRIVRRARGERVGTVVADLTVCGAVAPYSALAAGKLVGALAVSPKVLAAYREKYERPSEIASSMAGRPIVREARLSFIGTTSLYGAGSSQYNRLFWPADVMGGAPGQRIGFHEIGRSRSFGTSHFSDETVEALVRMATLYGTSHVRVNSLFGEGVSPRLRKVRLGLAALGWPTNDLLQHRRERIVYGVPLVSNVTTYSLGVDSDPEYLLDPTLENDETSIATWWFQRWGSRRAANEQVIEAVQSHTLVRPVTHGARVPLPRVGEVELPGTIPGLDVVSV